MSEKKIDEWTVRDEMALRMGESVIKFIERLNVSEKDMNIIAEFISEIVMIAFSTAGIPEREQEEEW